MNDHCNATYPLLDKCWMIPIVTTNIVDWLLFYDSILNTRLQMLSHKVFFIFNKPQKCLGFKMIFFFSFFCVLFSSLLISSQLILFSTVGGSFFVYGLYVCMCIVHSFASRIVLNKFHNVAIFIEAFILIHNKMKPLKNFQHHHYSVRSTDAGCVRQL